MARSWPRGPLDVFLQMCSASQAFVSTLMKQLSKALTNTNLQFTLQFRDGWRIATHGPFIYGKVVERDSCIVPKPIFVLQWPFTKAFSVIDFLTIFSKKVH